MYNRMVIHISSTQLYSCFLCLMGKRLLLLFSGLLIFAVAMTGFINISRCSIIQCDKRLTPSSVASDTLKSSSVINGFGPSLPSSASVRFMPFEHASYAVRHWDPASVRWLRLSDLPIITVSTANCTALFHSDRVERQKADTFQKTHSKTVVPTVTFVKDAFNCKQFVARRRYATSPVNREEAEFPIAFSILMFKDVEQFERLLRAVYRPQNLYCIHVDNKSNDDIHAAVRMIARCFENIFVVDQPYAVRWGTFSVLEPELACMRLLLKRSKKWKYFINLTGQEFPLKTNWQIVRILKAFNGSNNMEGTLVRFVLLIRLL